MRISGTLLDRLIVKILPLCLVFGLVFYMTTNKTLIEFAKPFGAAIAILWLFDSLTLLPKRIKRLTIENNYLTLGRDIILFGHILSITPMKDKRRGIDIKTVEIEYLKDGLIKKQRTIMIIPRSVT